MSKFHFSQLKLHVNIFYFQCTGEEVAVKVFTQPSDSRTLMIQQREFAVLKMLCHNNVVQLFAMEPEVSC